MRQHFNQRIFGLHLKQWREKYNFSQFEVAVHIGCSPAHISRLESGKFEDHKMEYLLLIADMMNVDFKDYITDRKD